MTRLAIASFLARFREPTLSAYTQNLKAFLGWCQQYEVEVPGPLPVDDRQPAKPADHYR